ncbi:MAG TPA: peptidylprolyl isomerase [Thermoanaerobaculia bacterium]|nr:peptidylprolyl isomerase [Thermoanaerobaculia bacterium]
MSAVTVLLLALLLPQPTAAPGDPLSDPDAALWSEPAPDESLIAVETSKGRFVIALHRGWAPIGADRFHALVRAGYYDDSRFFRVRAGELVQFGIAGDPEVARLWRERTIPDDPVLASNRRGTVAFAMTGPDTRSTQVFVNLSDNRELDAQGFAVIGEVVEGMEVLDALHAGYAETAGGGMRAGRQDPLFARGNRHLDERFPQLDRLLSAAVIEESPEEEPAGEVGGER